MALLYGPDAVALVKADRAAPLAGLPSIAFTKAELITRDQQQTTRRFIEFAEARHHPGFTAITSPRPDFGSLQLNRCHIMGIVNVTPDSFSDGGIHYKAETAITEARNMWQHGASILDVGGESTRPGSDPVSIDEERARIMPVISALAKDHKVSVDTRKALLMKEALSAGAMIINDVSALQFDTLSAATVAAAQAPVILMHAQGAPRTMQLAPKYDDVALDVYDQLAALIARAEGAGIARANIMVDVGVGFGKSFKQNLQLLQQLTLFHGLGVGLLVGVSRKGYIGAITQEKMAGHRLGGSIGGALQAMMQGAHMLRVHDVKDSLAALTVFNAALDPVSAAI